MRLILGTAVLLTIAGCVGSESDLSEDVPRRTFEEFRASVYKEPWPGGVYIVDQDIPITDDDELREYYEMAISGGDALTVSEIFGGDNIWEGNDRFELTYCISDSFGGNKQEVVNTMRAAANSWSDRIGVRYTYVPAEDDDCDASNTNVLFDVRPVDASYFARAFFPDEPRSARNVLIDGSAFTTSSGGRDLEGILRHELGHTLGFRHEHIWLDDPCTDEGTGNARQVTSYDVNSIMHYPQCRPSGTGGYRQTDTDFDGAQELYGTAAGVILASTSSLL